MRNNTVAGWLLAVSLALLIPGGVDATGLGRLTLLSTLGQPLHAEIDLTSVQQGASITARLASTETYQRYNLPFNSALAGTRVTLEKRPSGQVYLKATTPRAVSEPFIELLVEINSEHGRVTRQYTVLLDPPGYGSAAGEILPPVASPPATAPPIVAAPAGAPPAIAAAPPEPVAAPPKPVAAAPKPAATPGPAPQASGAKQYGPIKSGETLNSIARSVKPEGVSLEQVLVGIYGQNPDAFIGKNMNLLKSGKILQIPEASELAAVPVQTARQEVRLHVADFNTYRTKLADRAGAAPEGGGVASGRIGSRVAETAADEGPRDTVRLSRGDAGGKDKGKASAAERLRALEEEAIAREKTLTAANDRIAQLEKTIKDMQRLAELKGAGTDKAAKAPAASAPAVAVPAAKGPAPEAAQGPVPEAVKAPAPQESKGAVAELPKAAPPAPKAQPAQAAKAPPPPAPEQDFVDMLLSEPLYLAAGGAIVLLGLGVVATRRRRAAKNVLQEDDDMVKIAPTLGAGAEKSAALVTPAPSRLNGMPAPVPAAAGAAPAGDNDLDFNLGTPRTGAPAQDRPAPAPERPAVAAPETPAPSPRAPEPPPHVVEAPPVVEFAPAVELPRAPGRTSAADVLRAAQAQAIEPFVAEIAPEAPPAMPPAAKPAMDSTALEFNLNPLPVIGTPLATDNRVSSEALVVDFKLDLNSLDFDTPAKGPSATPARDDHWYDVQQKFDLAKAYEEMGDKDGTRDILQEVVKEGDAEQQVQAKKLLGSLS